MRFRTLSVAERAELLARLGERVTIARGGVTGERCRGDLVHTERVLEDMGKSAGEIRWILAELRELGGGCDCEVLLNFGEDDPP